MGCARSIDAQVPQKKSSKSILISSTVLRTKEEQNQFRDVVVKHLQKQLVIKDFQLLLRASEKGFSAAVFHQATNQISNTVLLFRTSKGNVFGAYTPCTWKNNVMYVYERDQGRKSFIFRLSLAKQDQNSPQLKETSAKICVLLNQQQAIMNHEEKGPVFGKGHDILIADGCDKNESWANMGKSYKCEYAHGSIKGNKFLGGEVAFLIEQYEVWSLKM